MCSRASSCVRKVRRTSSIIAPSERNKAQSPPPATTSPRSRSPSNDPPAAPNRMRRPSGPSPIFNRGFKSTMISKSGAVLIAPTGFTRGSAAICHAFWFLEGFGRAPGRSARGLALFGCGLLSLRAAEQLSPDHVGRDARLGAELRQVEEEALAGDQIVLEGKLDEHRKLGPLAVRHHPE